MFFFSWEPLFKQSITFGVLMSEWYDIHEEDIALDIESDEVNLYVADNDSGRIYGILTFDQIENIYNEINN